MERQILLLRSGGDPEELTLEGRGQQYRITRGQRQQRFEVSRLPDGRFSLLFEDGRQFCGRGTPRQSGVVEVSAMGRVSRIELAEPLSDRLAHSLEHSELGGEEEIRALMPGRVLEVCVKNADVIEPGALLLVLEAMKMQNEIRSVRGGIVSRVAALAGQTVEGGALLLTIQSVDVPSTVSNKLN